MGLGRVLRCGFGIKLHQFSGESKEWSVGQRTSSYRQSVSDSFSSFRPSFKSARRSVALSHRFSKLAMRIAKRNGEDDESPRLCNRPARVSSVAGRVSAGLANRRTSRCQLERDREGLRLAAIGARRRCRAGDGRLRSLRRLLMRSCHYMASDPS
jgi:hypothetical protein